MKLKLFQLYQKYKIAIIIALSIIILGIIGLFLYLNSLKVNDVSEYTNTSFSIKYDNSWKIDSQKDNYVLLKHNKDSYLKIETIPLENNYTYQTIDELIDDLIYDIENQNKNYHLISKEETLITKNQDKGYQLLYEDNDKQAMVSITKRSENLIIFTYTSTNKYFDILLDSVANIIYNFDIVTKSLDLDTEIVLNTKTIEWSQNEVITQSLGNSLNYESANNNYLVNYSIPSCFTISSINSTYGSFEYGLSDEISIDITAMVLHSNIYSYLNPTSGDLYERHNFKKENSNYSDFKETLEVVNDKDLTYYIYKNSYKYQKDTEYEEVEIIYELDNGHIFRIKLEGRSYESYYFKKNGKIPKELVDSIKLNSYQMYASYIKREVIDNHFTLTLKDYADYNKDKIKYINIKVPDKYTEIDHQVNMYETRYLSLNYNEEDDLNQYEIEYNTIYSKIDSAVEQENSWYTYYQKYDNYLPLTKFSDITINEKKFQVYKGGHTDTKLNSALEQITYYKNITVLFYQYNEDDLLTIIIEGNGSEISEDIIKDVTNFEIKIK